MTDPTTLDTHAAAYELGWKPQRLHDLSHAVPGLAVLTVNDGNTLNQWNMKALRIAKLLHEKTGLPITQAARLAVHADLVDGNIVISC